MSKYDGKSQTVSIVLAIFGGWGGSHRFYLGEWKKGTIYLVFCWTLIPMFVGWYDAYKYTRHKEMFGKSNGRVNGGGSSSIDSSLNSDEVSTKIPDGAVMEAQGVNGKVTLYEDRLEISREDIGMLHKMQHGFKGSKEMPYSSVTSVQLRKPSSVTRGYIQFGQSGFSESDDGLLDATSDENTVLFEEDSLNQFQELRTKVRDLKKGSINESTDTMDGALEKLRKRYANGDIDEEEYQQRKEILQGD